MKRRLATLLTLLTLLALPAAPAAAYDPFGEVCENAGTGSDSVACNQEIDDEGNYLDPISGEDGVIMQVISILAWVIGVASVIIIIISGMKYITANGDANSIKSAKNTLLYAIIGLLIFVSAQSIMWFVATRL